MTSVPELNSEVLWQHSLAVYGKPDVANACLALQDEYQVNVNLLLLYHWCLTHNVPVDSALVEALEKAVAVTEPQIQAHRQCRRAAKGRSDYEVLKQQELILEAAQQQALVAAFNAQPVNNGELLKSASQWAARLRVADNPHTYTLISTVLQA